MPAEDTDQSASNKLQQLFGLSGKKILVTGASQGIGRQVAIHCAAAGARIVLSARNRAGLEETAGLLKGGGHTILVADLNDTNSRELLASESGMVHGIVHCAGIRGLAPMKMVSNDFLNHVLQTNYISPVMLSREFLRRGSILSGGSVVFLSSIAALTGTVGVGPYAGSKAALVGSMRPMALELAKKGIRVNSLCPGLVETSLITEDKSWFEESAKRYPLGIGQPEDVASACLFFLSNASSKVTGTVFSMDGGVEFV
jgi:NAD(P)-dependent dehydrogenase (short-subunit alcohol dehydrogenase family)